MIIPVGPDGGDQELLQVKCSLILMIETKFQVDHNGDSGILKDDFQITKLMGVRYVPLVQASINQKNDKNFLLKIMFVLPLVPDLMLVI